MTPLLFQKVKKGRDNTLLGIFLLWPHHIIRNTSDHKKQQAKREEPWRVHPDLLRTTKWPLTKGQEVSWLMGDILWLLLWSVGCDGFSFKTCLYYFEITKWVCLVIPDGISWSEMKMKSCFSPLPTCPCLTLQCTNSAASSYADVHICGEGCFLFPK